MIARARQAPVRSASTETFVNGLRVQVRVFGPEGAPGVVLVHGGAAHGGWWDLVVGRLADRFRLAVPDLSGYGLSEHAPEYSLDRWVEECVAAATAAGITGPPVLVGHSQGGVVALRASERIGDRLAGVVAVDSGLRRWSAEELAPYRRKAAEGHRRYPDKDTALSRFALLPHGAAVSEEVRLQLAERALRQTREGWVWRYDPNTVRQEPIGPDDLAPARCPVALVVGERGVTDPGMNAAVVRALGGSIPVHVIAGTGHHLPVEAPADLLAVLLPLLEGWVRK